MTIADKYIARVSALGSAADDSLHNLIENELRESALNIVATLENLRSKPLLSTQATKKSPEGHAGFRRHDEGCAPPPRESDHSLLWFRPSAGLRHLRNLRISLV